MKYQFSICTHQKKKKNVRKVKIKLVIAVLIIIEHLIKDKKFNHLELHWYMEINECD